MAAVTERVGLPPLPRTGRFTALVVIGPQGQRESVSRTLRALGVREVVQAASVEEARRRAALLGGPAMCVADVSLPDGSGLTLLREPARRRLAARARPVARRGPLHRARGPVGRRPLLPRVGSPRRGRARAGCGRARRAPVDPRGRGAAARRERPLQQGDRRRARPVGPHRQEPPGPHRPQGRHRRPRRDGHARPARRGHRLTPGDVLAARQAPVRTGVSVRPRSICA
nr:hypothetical protein [Angustibacter aerolatus]